EHQRHKRDQVGILPQQRQQARRRVQVGEELVEADERRARIVGAAELLQQHGHQLAQVLLREVALERTVRARQPAAHKGGGFKRRLEAELSETVERLAVVVFRRKIQQRLVGRRRRFEQLGVVRLDLVEMTQQRPGEGIAVGKAEEARETL